MHKRRGRDKRLVPRACHLEIVPAHFCAKYSSEIAHTNEASKKRGDRREELSVCHISHKESLPCA